MLIKAQQTHNGSVVRDFVPQLNLLTYKYFM